MRAESADTEISIMEEYVEVSIFTSKSTYICSINIIVLVIIYINETCRKREC